MEEILIKGWIRTRRDSKTFSFLEINDGSCLKNLQVIVDEGIADRAIMENVATGAAVSVIGRLIPSQGKNQTWEVTAKNLELIGKCAPSYPLQKKGHSVEFLREIAHLRPRTNLFGCVFRIRSRLAQAVHQFFQQRDFFYIHTPIITAGDCEGAGELFKVTTLDPVANKSRIEEQSYHKDFFGKPTFLTVSGQLEAEVFATSLSNVYTFGPTFRAENSNTSRHASEFWMIEPEMAFYDLQDNMDLAEAFIKELIRQVLTTCEEDLSLLGKFVDRGLQDRLNFVLERPFTRIRHSEAVTLLKSANQSFEFPVEEGLNLQSEHERWLTEKHFKCPVTIYNYPSKIKPFYMRRNDDGQTTAAMDVLVPGIGEIIGGSQREERLDYLLENMTTHGLKEEDYDWYLDLRRYGSVPHSGFGLGFERMLMFVTGITNIRDVIPFVRTPGNAEF